LASFFTATPLLAPNPVLDEVCRALGYAMVAPTDFDALRYFLSAFFCKLFALAVLPFLDAPDAFNDFFRAARLFLEDLAAAAAFLLISIS